MCMIVYRPVNAKSGRGANIPGAVIDTALRRHPDGFGVAYREHGVLVTEKFGPHEAKRFRKALKRIDREGAREYVAHFRFATHGDKDAAHAHPYEYTHPIDGRVLVFHNGVIDIATRPHESDTEVFVRDVLAKLPSRWWEQPHLMYLVTETIGYSKLTVMTSDGTYNLHEKRGDWDGGLWYSSAHKPSTYTYKGPAPTGGQTWDGKWTTRVAAPATPAAPATDKATARDVIVTAPPRTFASSSGLVMHHGGHLLSAMLEFDRSKDGDYPGAVLCEECFTMGDVYVIDGGVYIDMAHKADNEPDEEVCGA